MCMLPMLGFSSRLSDKGNNALNQVVLVSHYIHSVTEKHGYKLSMIVTHIMWAADSNLSMFS